MNLENRYSRITIKIVCEAYMFKTIYRTQGTQRKSSKRSEILVIMGAPYFSQYKPKIYWLHFLSYLINLNKQLKRKPYAMPNINEMLLKMEVF